MGELLFKIYEQVISEGEEARNAGNRIEKYVNGLIVDDSEVRGDEETEELKDLMYSAADKAEREGFRLGAWFALRLIFELFSESPEA
ncbi:MAG: hypothetical protein K2N43_08540 [Lachnospiraceae bacterium]|nr:hypothetical protein [Lachnospiraceae bacterium]